MDPSRAPFVQPDMRSPTLLLTTLALWATAADAAPRAQVLGLAPGEVAAHAGPIEAVFGQPVRLFAAVQDGRTWYSDAPRIRVGRRVVTPRPLADLGPVTVTWRLVEPHPHHVATPSPNFGNPAYSNNVLFGPRHGKWLGYDTLDYQETPLPASGGALEIDRARPSFPQLAVNAGMGTVRYAVTVTAGGATYASPGAEAIQRGGIAPSVFRVSFRAGEGLLGYLPSYFNVPNVFGSAGVGRRHQTELHQGADCADVIIGAARKAGARIEYTSVAGLARYTDPVSPRLYFDGAAFRALTDEGPGEPVSLRWADDVQPGDVLLIKYARADFTGRRWDHVGVLEADAGAPGVLDGADPLLHIGYLHGLARQPIASQGLMVVQVVRFKKALRRTLVPG